MSTDLSDLGAFLKSDTPTIDGVVARPGARWPVNEVADALFSNCDFRSVCIERTFGTVSFANCAFRNVVFDGARWRRVHFVSCQFAECRIGDSALSHLERVVFEDTSWTGGVISSAVLSSCAIRRSTFESTYWSDVRLRRGELCAVSFPACSFETVLFDSCALEDIDFSGSRFRELSYVAVDIRGSFLPAVRDECYMLCRPANLESWVEAVRTEMGCATAESLERDLGFLRETGWPLCIDGASLEEVQRAQRAEVLAIGRRVAETPGPSESR